jgi:1,4-alpha-glucan branching enzyme
MAKSTKKVANSTVNSHFSLFTEFDIYLFKQGKHFKLYEKLGAHLVEHHQQQGCYFAVWAPNAALVSVTGDFNAWNPERGIMEPRLDGSGIWEVFIPGACHGQHYKYMIRNAQTGMVLEKFDPFAYFNEVPPKRASVIWDLSYSWNDKPWVSKTGKGKLQQAWSVYEVHAGSWKKSGPGEDDYLSYADMARELVPYVKEMGFTHVEFMPLTEHPYAGSWGYQTTGYFAPTSRFGNPQELMALIDAFHAEGIGVIMDWVPSHFPEDAFALAKFDGTCLFEHEDLRKGYHPDWKSLIFNYGRYEVRSFLISSAMFWADLYHVDGLRVDAVASMLYLDYSREAGQWEPNIYGGNENLEAISFMRELNETLFKNFPEIQVIAEESTSWPMVSRPVYLGGLGYGMKWMMGWMHDTLKYFKTDPIFREYHQNDLTFSLYYAFTENFMLPLSHDEVVHGKGSLLQRMPGDEWQRFANLRAMFGYMFTHPGSKLLFMGGEIAQHAEWNYKSSIDWHLLDSDAHRGIQNLIRDLNHLYRNETALHALDFSPQGFEWLDLNDHKNCVLSYLRKSEQPDDYVMVVCNLTPVPHENYRLGVPRGDAFTVIFNSDAERYGGSGYTQNMRYEAEEIPRHDRAYSVALTLPPLSVLVLKAEVPAQSKTAAKKAGAKSKSAPQAASRSQSKAKTEASAKPRAAESNSVEPKKVATKKPAAPKTETRTKSKAKNVVEKASEPTMKKGKK